MGLDSLENSHLPVNSNSWGYIQAETKLAALTNKLRKYTEAEVSLKTKYDLDIHPVQTEIDRLTKEKELGGQDGGRPVEVVTREIQAWANVREKMWGCYCADLTWRNAKIYCIQNQIQILRDAFHVQME